MLVLALVKQPGYEFVMLTPNPDVAKIFTFLKFRPVDRRLAILPCVPWPLVSFSGAQVASRQGVVRLLGEESRTVYEDHAHLPWLEHVAVGRPGASCYIVFKRTRIKRLPVARVLHVSNPELFRRYWGVLRRVLLTRHGLMGVVLEKRWVGQVPWPALIRLNGQPKLLHGTLIDDAVIDDLYSELVALDL